MKALLCVLVFCSSSLLAIPTEAMKWKETRHYPHGNMSTLKEALQRELTENNPRHRPIPFKITHYALDIDADPDTWTLRGTSTITLRSLMKDLYTLTVDAYDMKIKSVLLEKEETRFDYDGEMLSIHLKKPLAYNEKTEIKIVYEAVRSQSFYRVGPNILNMARMKTAYTFTEPEGSRKWFPCIDRPFAKAPFEIKVRVPEAYKVLSNGILLSQNKIKKTIQYHYKMEEAIAPYLVSLAIGAYEIVSLGEFQDKPLTLWTPPLMKEAAIHDTKRTNQMMDIFSRFTGVDYPFDSYAQAIAPSWEDSMEHQGSTTLGSWVITNDSSDEATVAHELAHQWFGNWVTPETWGELWLSEGFASYMPYVFYAEVDTDNKALGEVDDWRVAYFTEARRIAHALSPINPNVDMIFDAHAYEKGALVIKLMRFIANLTPSDDEDETFQKAVHNYLTDHGQKTVRNTDLQVALEGASQHSWQIFFDQWVRSAGHPRLRVEFENKGADLILKIQQTQALDPKLDWPTFQFPIPVDFYAENGTKVRRIIDIFDDEQELKLQLGFQVAAVDFDPDWEMPVEIQVHTNLQPYMHILKHSSSLTSRIRASRDILSVKAVPDNGFIERVLADSSLYLKADAMAKLSKNTENRDAIVRILGDLLGRKAEWDYMIRNAVASAKAWIVKNSTEIYAESEEKKLQDAYLHEYHTILERKSILEKLATFSLPHAQDFAIARLKEGRWFMRDRANLNDLLTKNPRPEILPFLKEALKTSGHLWLGKMSINLLAANFDRKEIVPILLERAKNDPMIAARKSSLELLTIQKSSKDFLCPELLRLENSPKEKPDRTYELRFLAEIARENLKCPGARLLD